METTGNLHIVEDEVQTRHRQRRENDLIPLITPILRGGDPGRQIRGLHLNLIDYPRSGTIGKISLQITPGVSIAVKGSHLQMMMTDIIGQVGGMTIETTMRSEKGIEIGEETRIAQYIRCQLSLFFIGPAPHPHQLLS